MAMKILVNKKEFRKWNTAQAEVKKYKGEEVEIQIQYKSDRDKKYRIVTTTNLISVGDLGDLKNEILKSFDNLINIRNEERKKYFESGDINKSNIALSILNRLESTRFFIYDRL